MEVYGDARLAVSLACSLLESAMFVLGLCTLNWDEMITTPRCM